MEDKHIVGVFLVLAGLYVIFFAPSVPKLMNYVIMGLYITSMIWWLWKGHPWDAGYWVSAFLITFVVTFGYGRK